MSNLTRLQSQSVERSWRLGSPASGLARQTNRALANVEGRTLVRLANVQAEATVQVEKLHEVDRLVREAVTGQAFLQHWATHLARGDVFLADDLRFFTEIAKIGKGEIIADTVDSFCRESRG